jgi:hypothetical protein
MLVAVSIATPFGLVAWLHACTGLVTPHLHASFHRWLRVSAVLTVGPAIGERRASQSARSHKGRCAKDGRKAVANAAKT